MSKNALVFLSADKNTPLTSSDIIAKSLHKRPTDVLELAKKYKDDLLELGAAPFKTEQVKRGSGARDQLKEIAILNEQQATYLVTLMRNSPEVRRFKLALVKAFFEMRDRLKHEAFRKKSDELIRNHLKSYTSTLNHFEQALISTLVHDTAKTIKLTVPEIYNLMYCRYHVPSYKLLNRCQVESVINWLKALVTKGDKILHHAHFTNAHVRALKDILFLCGFFEEGVEDLLKKLEAHGRLAPPDPILYMDCWTLLSAIRLEFGQRHQHIREVTQLVESIPVSMDEY